MGSLDANLNPQLQFSAQTLSPFRCGVGCGQLAVAFNRDNQFIGMAPPCPQAFTEKIHRASCVAVSYVAGKALGRAPARRGPALNPPTVLAHRKACLGNVRISVALQAAERFSAIGEDAISRWRKFSAALSETKDHNSSMPSMPPLSVRCETPPDDQVLVEHPPVIAASQANPLYADRDQHVGRAIASVPGPPAYSVRDCRLRTAGPGSATDVPRGHPLQGSAGRSFARW